MTAPQTGRSPIHSVVIHGHFYQPPRDDPWTGLVGREPSAAPDHDWTARIERECYAPLAGVRPASPSDGPIGNLFAALSFNVGANLCEWLQRSAPDTYAAILGADRRSARRFAGHGNAIAMPYDHIILPLATRRDKVTEVRWGMADFTRRFGRAPGGMWLPETAVDEETLNVLASEGIRFTILAPHQIENPPDDGLPVAFATSGGRTLALFTYDGPAAGEIAFGELLADPTGAALAARLAPNHAAPVPPDGDAVTAIATDGETFGHHHRLGGRALAGAVARLRANHAVRLENFASILARHPPTRAGRIRADTSWSCPHGIERWRSNCACHVGPVTAEEHRWRAPLRAALDWLAAQLHETFEREGAQFFDGPWGVRDGYGAVVAGDGDVLRDHVLARLRPAVRATADATAYVRARELLELERSALRMFTSDGWFFDAITGIEVQLLLRAAAHALGLAGVGAGAVREEFLKRLVGDDRSGAPAVPLVPDPDASDRRALAQAAAGIVRVRTIAPQLRETRIGQYDVSVPRTEPDDTVRLEHRRTGRTDRIVVADEAQDVPEREAAFLDLAKQIGVGPAHMTSA